ncbi:hypothetical protein DSL64_09360 [Dyadobacter luteus]|uniref:asparagine synthase (glutamine-hydrolyzing) n=1 Tax=Dyadobacter luteus TaxID=2259619 RepID=A0A3D8YDC5_9BACT|nr:asparagine synthetase B family protein [Dyadobacter luteus]REA62451.1 hypothetical protein DSL64_09360 [Dyadobacter luteus]
MFIEGFISFDDIKVELKNKNHHLINFERSSVNFSVDDLKNTKRGIKLFVRKTNGRFLEILSDSLQQRDTSKDFLCLDNDELQNIGIAIWVDESTNSIHIYREIFGQVPLYYLFIPHKFFIFSTSLPALLRNELAQSYHSFDYYRIYRYSIYAADSRDYYSGDTFYENIKSVLPGHILKAEAHSLSSQPGFTYKLAKTDNLNSLSYAGNQFREVFLKSIQSLANDESKIISSQLSGGLDSSSVSCTLRYLYPNRKIITLFGLTDSSLEERNYSSSTAEWIKSIHCEVEPRTDQRELLYSHTLLYGHPQRYLSGSFFQTSIMEQAKSAGANIMLTGHLGDQIVHNGFDLLSQVLAKKNWTLLNQLLDQRAFFASQTANFKHWDLLTAENKKNLFKQHFFFKKFLSVLKKGNVGESLILLHNWHLNIGLSTNYFIQSLWNVVYNKFNSSNQDYLSMLNKDFVEHAAEMSITKNTHPYSGEYENWAAGIYTTQGIGINEEFFSLGNEYKITPLFPFCDKDLYELSLSIPLSVKFNNGLGRGHFRESMKGILPEIVRTRPNKTQFGLYGREVALRSFDQLRDTLSVNHQVWQYIDKKKLQRAIANMSLEKDKNTTNASLVNRMVALAVWLDINQSGSYYSHE